MENLTHLVKMHRLWRKLAQYPELIQEVRGLFVEALTSRRIVDGVGLRQQIQDQWPSDTPSNEDLEMEYALALIDFYVAAHLTEKDIDGIINLARKKEAFAHLELLVHSENTAATDVLAALGAFARIPEGSLVIPADETEGVRVALITRFISGQLPFVGVAKQHFAIGDIYRISEQTHWNPRRPGRIGGKAAGMFLAHKVLLPGLPDDDPELVETIACPETYCFDSGFVSDFIDFNRFRTIHSQKYKSQEALDTDFKIISAQFEAAPFPPDVDGAIREFLDAIGEHPLIVRSSSLLEDNVGYTFSGKYDSVFLANQGDIDTRIRAFSRAVKQVYCSVFSPSAILYRRDHNLLDYDERMAVLVQKVVGRRVGNYFFPLAAGVAFSRNVYAWTPRIRLEEGLVRLVMGLGTRAVDRVAQDYPRMVPLSHPLLRPEASVERIRKYSQKLVDVIDLNERRLKTLSFLDLLEHLEPGDLQRVLSVDEGGHLAPPGFLQHAIAPEKACVTFEAFLSRPPFVKVMRKVLRTLESAYGRPVDVEFAWDQGRLYILQCRAMAVGEDVGRVVLPVGVREDQVLFTNEFGVPNGVVRDIEYIVYVDPRAYARLSSYEERLAVARAVGRVNRKLEGKRYALLGPARWGSGDPQLGVRVGYEDIHHTLLLGEVAFQEEGVTAEASFGTHFYNDLVEARIMPVAIYPDQPGVMFSESFLLESPNLFLTMVPDLPDFATLFHVIHVPSSRGGDWLHVYQDGSSQRGMGLFAPPTAGEAEVADTLTG